MHIIKNIFLFINFLITILVNTVHALQNIVDWLSMGLLSN